MGKPVTLKFRADKTLEDIEEVEIMREGNRIVLVPIVQDDPIWQLGTKPINCDVTDASENLDAYLYGSV